MLIQLGDDLEGKDVPWSSDLLLDTCGGLAINVTTSASTPKKTPVTAASCILFTQESLGNGKGSVSSTPQTLQALSLPVPTASKGWLALVTGKQGVTSTKGKPLMTSPHTSDWTEKLKIILIKHLGLDVTAQLRKLNSQKQPPCSCLEAAPRCRPLLHVC